MDCGESGLLDTKDVLLSHVHSMVSETTPQYADDVTGMFACMDPRELMAMLGNPELLQTRIKTALAALKRHNAESRTDKCIETIPYGSDSELHKHPLDRRKEEIANQLFVAVAEKDSQLCAQITGMLLDLDTAVLEGLLADQEALNSAVDLSRTEYLRTVELREMAPEGSPDQEALGEQVFASACQLYPRNAAKLTGMMMDLGPAKLRALLEKGAPQPIQDLLSDCRKALQDTGQWLAEDAGL